MAADLAFAVRMFPVSSGEETPGETLAAPTRFGGGFAEQMPHDAGFFYTVLKITDLLEKHGPVLSTSGLREILDRHTGHLQEAANYADVLYREGRSYCLPLIHFSEVPGQEGETDVKKWILRFHRTGEGPDRTEIGMKVAISDSVELSVETVPIGDPAAGPKGLLPREAASYDAGEQDIKAYMDQFGRRLDGPLPAQAVFYDEITGLISPEDMARIKRALTAGREYLVDHKSGEHNEDYIDGISGAMEYPFVRNAVIRLRNPVSVSGRNFRYAKLKYILLPAGDIEEVRAIEGQPKHVIEAFEGRAEYRKSGSYVIGGADLADAYRESFVSNEMFFFDNHYFKSNPHLASGYFIDKDSSTGNPQGFNISLIEDDIRWGDRLREKAEIWEKDRERVLARAERALDWADQEDLSEVFFPLYLRNFLFRYGELMADQHRLGYSHGQMNLSNISGDMDSPVLIDLSSAGSLKRVRPEDRMTLIMNDINMILGTVMYGKTADLCEENGILLPAKEVLRGYFSDMDSDEMPFDIDDDEQVARIVESAIRCTVEFIKSMEQGLENFEDFAARQDDYYIKLVSAVQAMNVGLSEVVPGSSHGPSPAQSGVSRKTDADETPKTFFRSAIPVERVNFSDSSAADQVLLEVVEMSDLKGDILTDVKRSIRDWERREPVVHRSLLGQIIEDLANRKDGSVKKHKYMHERVYFAFSRPGISGDDAITVEGIITVDDLGDGNPMVNCLEIRPRNRWLSVDGGTAFRGVGRQLIFNVVNRELENMAIGTRLSFSIPGANIALEREGLVNEKLYTPEELSGYIRKRDMRTLEEIKRAQKNGSESSKAILAMTGAAPREIGTKAALTEPGYSGAQAMIAQFFVDSVIQAIDSRESADSGERIMVAVDMSWIPREQRAVIQGMLNGLSNMFGMKGTDSIVIVRGNGRDLADEIDRAVIRSEKENWEIKTENMVIIGAEDVFIENRNEFLKYMEGGAFFGKIVVSECSLGTKDLGTTDLRLLEKIAEALRASIVRGEKSKRFIIIPDAEMMDLADLARMYEARLSFIRSL